MTARDDLPDVICNMITAVIKDNRQEIISVASHDTLRESLQLDSLDLAVIVVRLEQELGIDPFRQHRQPVRTVGELIAVYQQATPAS